MSARALAMRTRSISPLRCRASTMPASSASSAACSTIHSRGSRWSMVSLRCRMGRAAGSSRLRALLRRRDQTWRRLRSSPRKRACAGTNGQNFSAVLFSLSRPCLLGQIAPQPLAHVVGLFRRPGAKAFAALHAELAGLDLLAQERMRARTPIQVGDEHVADVEGEIEPDEIGLFHRAKPRHASAEAALHHRVDRLGVADAGGNERDRLTLQGVLQAVADEARNVAAHMDRLAAGSGKEIDGAA